MASFANEHRALSLPVGTKVQVSDTTMLMYNKMPATTSTTMQYRHDANKAELRSLAGLQQLLQLSIESGFS